MYRLLIAGDESIEREMLSDFIDWASLGVELAGSAESAEEAVNLSLTTYFDLFLTDARMQGAPGHELARLLLQHQPRLKVIISGNFMDFDEALQSEDMRGCSFVAKPYNIGELKAVVTRLVKELDDERARAKSGEHLRQLVQENTPLIRRHFFERLVFGQLSDSEIVKNLDRFGMGSVQGRFTILLPELDGFDRLSMSQNWESLQMMLEAVRESILGLKLDGLLDIFYIERGRFAALLCLSSVEQQREARHVFAAAESIRGEAALCAGGSVTVGTGCTVSRIRDLRFSYRAASAALSCKGVVGRGQVISWSDTALPSSEPVRQELSALEEALALSVELGNAQEARGHVDRLMTAARRGNWGEKRAMAACMRLMTRLQALLSDAGEPDDEVFMNGESWVRLLSARDLPEMTALLNACVTAASERFHTRRVNAGRAIVSRMLEHIEKNLERRITAADLADEFACSPNHIGLVFKQEIGKALPDFVRDARLERACELLHDPSNRIGEVAIKVGYPNVSYFCSLFKKKYGVNPGEYRER